MRKFILILLVAFSSTGLLNADVLTYTIIPNSGQFNYNFTLQNTGATGGTLFDLFLALPTAITNIDTTTIGTPVGWGDPTGGQVISGPDTSPTTSFIDWSSDFSGNFDLGIGNSLSGFSFSSLANVGQPITFALNGSTDFGTAQQQVSGVPEPATFLLMLPLIAVFGIRSRSHQSR